MKGIEIETYPRPKILVHNQATVDKVQQRLNEMCDEWNKQMAELTEQIKEWER